MRFKSLIQFTITLKWVKFLTCSIMLIAAFPAFDNPREATIKTFKFSFSAADEFNVSYADYPKGEEQFYELKFEQGAKLPPEIITAHTGLKLSGNNHSDDLFMFAFKKLEGLTANTMYHVKFSVEFAANAASNSMGTGGSSGSSVFMKMGVVAKAPRRYVDNANNLRINLDKGAQQDDGKDMLLLGTIGVETQGFLYRLKTLPYQPSKELTKKLTQFTITTNQKGEAWLIIGIDSAFESKTTIFLTNAIVSFKPIYTVNE